MTTSTPPPRASAPGPVLFARYAYPPNALGYCGPGDPGGLLERAAAGADLGGLGHLAARFEGAWPYLQLIAAANGLRDPLDPRVVRAYWVGNELVGRVPPAALARSLADRFEHPAGRRLGAIVAPVPEGAVPHHSFHVFAVYPWLGLLRAGMEGAPMDVLERCRIRWGTVEALSGDLVLVRSRPLVFDGSRLDLGPARTEEVRRSVEGVGLAHDLVAGDTVSLHWDWVCDRLTPGELRWLRACTRRNLDAVNATAAPGPAAACGA